MAGYKIKALLIAQSLNQIEKAYGNNNSILDNCHVRVSFSTNDERTAKRVSDALGTATELRAMKNYAGHRLSPWLGHLMVSRSETPRPLLTPGEVMQLPPSDEIVMVAGLAPIRAKKARYYTDKRLAGRVGAAPKTMVLPAPSPDDWTAQPPIAPPGAAAATPPGAPPQKAELSPQELRRVPELGPRPKPKGPETIPMEFGPATNELEDRVKRLQGIQRSQQQTARQASLDPGDGVEL